MIPYLNMESEVTIGQLVVKQVTSFRIEEHIKKLGNTAVVVLPRNLGKLKGKPVLDYIHVGDKVTIKGGYNGKIDTEFTGYVSSIGSETPLVIMCDDELYPLKQNSLVKSYAAVTLKKLLQDSITGYKIDCPDMSLGKYIINGWSSFRVLQELQKDFGLYARINGDTLKVAFSWAWDTGTKNHKYNFQKNVKNKGNLVWKQADDLRTRVEVKLDKVKGQAQKTVTFGSTDKDASVFTVNYNGLDATAAKAVAEAIYTTNNYSGFRGSFRGFGMPRTHAGDSVDLAHEYEPEKNGSYLLESVIIGYDAYDKYYRDNYISYKI